MLSCCRRLDARDQQGKSSRGNPQLIQVLYQEIIKVREWIPHIGLLTKVIPLKLFLDMVPSSSEDVARSMPAWTAETNFSKLPETKWRERHCRCFDFVSQQRCFQRCQSSFLIGRWVFARFVPIWLFIILFSRFLIPF